jgi:hypothetical protein
MLGVGLAWLWRVLVVVPLAALWRYVLAPVGRALAWTLGMAGTGLAWLAQVLLVLPLIALYRYVLAPVGREIWAALRWAWRVAGYISHALGRVLAWLGRVLLVVPVRWAWRVLVGPAGRWLRQSVWWPVRRALAQARETVRQVRADVRRALFGVSEDR